MIRALTILAAVAALAVSAAPVASAGPSKKPPPRGTAAQFELSIDGHSMFHGSGTEGERGFAQRGKAKVPRPGGSGIIAILIG